MFYEVDTDFGEADNSAMVIILETSDLFWTWDIVLATTLVRTTTQYFSYDLNQLLAELGGSWGLFLGASLVTIFEFVDKIIARLLLAVGEI